MDASAAGTPRPRRVPLPSELRPRRSSTAREETSAGGLVLDFTSDPPSAVLIGRLDRRGQLMWSMPKGHVEPGETIEEAARREVREETGIVGDIIAPLGTIDFWFMAEGRRIHKTVHHFLMRRVGGTVNTDDPEVVEVQWVDLSALPRRLAYADERRLLGKVPEILADAR